MLDVGRSPSGESVDTDPGIPTMPSKREAALMPDGKANGGPTSGVRPSGRFTAMVNAAQCISSVLLRLGVYLFTRWIPSGLSWPIVPLSYAMYLLSWLVRSRSLHTAAAGNLQELAESIDAKNKIGKTVGNEHMAQPAHHEAAPGPLRSLITGISGRLSSVNLFNLVLHSLLFAFYMDAYASPYIFPSHYEHNLISHRVADVGPTHAKIHLRWPEPIPLFEGFEEDVAGSGILRDGRTRSTKPFRLVYREIAQGAGATRWDRGPLITLVPEDDWASTVTLANLWPNTEYEYRLAWTHNNTFVSPHRLIDFEREWPSFESDAIAADKNFVGGRLRTWPDPRAGRGMGGLLVAPSSKQGDDFGDDVPLDDPNHFKFVTSSCVKPDFPWSPSQFAPWSWLLRLLPSPRQLFPAFMLDADATVRLSDETDDWAKRNNIKGFDLLYERYIRGRPRPNVRFLLQLGDLIYADVPRFGGPFVERYRKLYRNLFASASFRRAVASIPMIGIYDDHEVKNNWAGLTEDEATRSAVQPGSKAWYEYVGAGNPDPLDAGENYYTFRYGNEAAFFVLDTRKYRVASKGFGLDGEDDEDWDQLSTSGQPFKTALGQQQKEALLRWMGAVNSTATFKFVVSSVPFTSLWGGIDGKVDSWAAYLAEREELLEVMQYVPNLIVLSGDRHEAAMIGLRAQNSPKPDSYPIIEMSTSPLSMFYVPLIRTLSHDNGRGPTGQEKILKYFPDGNFKWTDIEVDTRRPDTPQLIFRLWIDGKMAWKLKYVGQPVKVGEMRTVASGVVKSLRELLGWRPRRWF